MLTVLCEQDECKRYFFMPLSQNMVATGQEMVRETKILQGQGKVREFYSGSGKIGILKKSQGKLKW